MIYKVTVNPDYRWNDCQVAGRIFSKKTVVEIGGAAMNDEIRNSPLLQIEEIEADKPVVAEIKPELLDDTIQPRKRGRPAQSEDK